MMIQHIRTKPIQISNCFLQNILSQRRLDQLIGCKHEVYDTKGCFVQNYNYKKGSFLNNSCQQTTL